MVTLVLSILLTAQTTMVSDLGFTSLNNSTHHLIDPTLELQASEVMKDYTSGRTRKASSLSLGFDDAAHWFITPVENPTANTRWVLEFEYPLLDFIDVYIVRSDGSLEQALIGDRCHFRNATPSRFLHLPVKVAQNESITILWRITTQTSLIAGARIAPSDLWTHSRSTEVRFKFFAYGLFFMLGCLQLVLGIWTGDRSALLLSATVGSIFVATVSLDGLSSQLFDAFSPDLRKALTLVSIAVFAAVLLQLISALLISRSFRPSGIRSSSLPASASSRLPFTLLS